MEDPAEKASIDFISTKRKALLALVDDDSVHIFAGNLSAAIGVLMVELKELYGPKIASNMVIKMGLYLVPRHKD